MGDQTDADVRLVRIIKEFYEVGKQTEQLLSGGEDRETVLDGLLRVFQDVQHIHDRLTACTPQDVFSHVIIRYLEMLEKLVEEIESDKGVSARTKESLIQLHIRIVMKMKRMLIDHHADDLLHDQGFLEFSAQYMDVAYDRLRDEDFLDTLKGYDHIYLWGADHESALTYLFFVESQASQRITAFLSEDGGERLFDKDVKGLDEVGLSQKDAVIICDGNQIRKSDLEFLKKNSIPNVIELNIYDARNYYYYLALDEKAYRAELKYWYTCKTGKKLDLEHPRTWNEGIQWMKLYERDALKTRLADKYLVRDWVRDKLGEEYLVPIYGVWERFDDIDLSKLPDKFVLKYNHGSGFNLIVDDKNAEDWKEAKKCFDAYRDINYAFFIAFELHYKDIKPLIIAEKKLEVAGKKDIEDYKVFVFRGEAKFIQVDIDRSTNHRRNLYSRDWELLPYQILYPRAPEVTIERPDCLEELISAAEKLGEGFRHVRVDFYIVDGHIYFGEMTFTHGGGLEKVTPESFDLEMGKWMGL